ncbi:MAG: tetratricopeptide repeat protein [Xanthomonadales bacterium]|nr:tetratricopeptide repeat protein [Xanthomonadales bacterium]
MTTQDKLINQNLLKVLRRNLRQAIRTRDVEQADSLLQRLKLEDPLSIECRGLELEYLLITDHQKEAQLLAEQLLHLYPNSARIHYLAGRVDYQAKRYPQALAGFTESNSLFPHWRARLWCGKSFTQLGKYPEAEALLLELYTSHPQTGRDLAWLYERLGNSERALHYLQRYLDRYTDSPLAEAQLQRLRSHTLPPEDLLAEVEMLTELGEEIPPQMLVTYLQRLLEKGEGKTARKFINEQENNMEPKTAVSLAWVCYRLQAYDLALQLFLIGLPVQIDNYKYLQSLEKAAGLSDRLENLITTYEQYAPEQKKLYGRIKRLRKFIEK